MINHIKRFLQKLCAIFGIGPTKVPLTLTRRSLQKPHPRPEVPGGVGEFATGDVGPGLASQCHRVVIGLTRDLLVVIAWPEQSPASGSGGTGAARPRWREVRRGNRWG
jgi:hypothetical protein